MPDMSHARRVMVDNQIRTFDVTDRDVLAAFDQVPRERFVPADMRALAYSDRRIDVPVAGGLRSLLPPLVLARLIQALQPRAGESALDCFGGLGYSAAILAAIGLETTMVETDAGLAGQARAALADIGPAVKVAPAQPSMSATSGAAFGTATFDIILVNGASEVEPAGFFSLLREGGRLGIIQRTGSAARAVVYLKSLTVVSPRPAFDAQMPVLPGFAREAGFVF